MLPRVVFAIANSQQTKEKEKRNGTIDLVTAKVSVHEQGFPGRPNVLQLVTPDRIFFLSAEVCCFLACSEYSHIRHTDERRGTGMAQGYRAAWLAPGCHGSRGRVCPRGSRGCFDLDAHLSSCSHVLYGCLWPRDFGPSLLLLPSQAAQSTCLQVQMYHHTIREAKCHVDEGSSAF